MIGPGTGVRVYLAAGVTDMRKGIAGLGALAQNALGQNPVTVSASQSPTRLRRSTISGRFSISITLRTCLTACAKPSPITSPR